MGASNTTSGGNTQYFKLKQEKINDRMTGKISFARQEKVNDTWQATDEFSSMTGYLKELVVKDYDYQGQPKKNLELHMVDNENQSISIIVSLGFDSGLSRTILNTLAGEDKIGLLSFECGSPNTVGDKVYPTLWIKNNGEKTTWKWSEKNGNKNEIPAVTSAKDEDGNIIKKGVKAATEFWLSVVRDINASHEGNRPAVQANQGFASQQPQSEFAPNDDSGLPWENDPMS